MCYQAHRPIQCPSHIDSTLRFKGVSVIVQNMLGINALQKLNLKGPILVTGHTGFKGAWLTHMLSISNVENIGLSWDRNASYLYQESKTKPEREFFFDIADFSAVEKVIQEIHPSIVIHLAAQSLVLESYREPLNTFKTNVLGTANILESSRSQESIKAILVATTDKVYKNNNVKKRFKESDELKGSDPYSSSKVATEMCVNAWRNTSNLLNRAPISIVRSGNVVGGGDLSPDRLFPDIIRSASNGIHVEIRNPMSTRPWQHVLDPLNGYLLTIAKSIKDQDDLTYNFGPITDSLNVKTATDIFCEELKIPTKILSNELKSRDKQEAQYLDLDANLAMSELKWRPHFSQNQSIIQTAKWWNQVIVEKKNCREVTNLEIEEFHSNQNLLIG
jgi:CDP-glucose 4,6-dehydratase